MIRPIHDVKAPEEVVEPPSAGSDSRDPTGVGRDKDAGGIEVGERDAPGGERAAIFGAGALDPLYLRRWSSTATPCQTRDLLGLTSRWCWQRLARRGVEQARSLGCRDLGDRAAKPHAIGDGLDGRICCAYDRRWWGERAAAGKGRRGFAVNEVIAMHPIDRQEAHQGAACEP